MRKIASFFLIMLLPLCATAYSLTRVSVHDPSIVWEPTTKTYYIFGSHRAVAKTTDLMNWTEVKLGQFPDGTRVGVPWQTASSNNATSQTTFTKPAVTKVVKGGREVSLPAFDAVKWSSRGSADYKIEGKDSWGNWGTNLWAPDVIWNKVMKKWCMYMSVNGDYWYSSIVLLTADQIEGPYVYQGPVAISGFYSGDAYKDTDLELVLGALSSLPERYNTGRSWGDRYPNNIDPCVFYDEDGKLWMSYGSWSGGIWILELDEKTGLRNYDVEYPLTGSGDGITVDPYFGKKIAGGYYSSGEASYIEYIGGYYYLFVTNGGLLAGGDTNAYNNGGYQMRVFRSEKPDGPYVDARSMNAVYPRYMLNFGPDANCNYGINIFGAYTNWGNQVTGNLGERSQGHNSVIAAEDGRTYLVYHTRFQNWGEAHQVRVHQVFQNQDGWLVAAPFEYTGEEVKSADIATTQKIPASQIPGKYKLLTHTYRLNHMKKEAAKPIEVELNADGTITGEVTGTDNKWDAVEGTCYVNITLNSLTYKCVMVEQTMEPSDTKVAAFTGTRTSGITIWGYKYEDFPSGINNVEDDIKSNGPLFDLQGHRITSPRSHGIYIQNGKKYVKP